MIEEGDTVGFRCGGEFTTGFYAKRTKTNDTEQ